MFSVWKWKRGNILDIISVKVLLEDILELVVAVKFPVSNLSLAWFPFFEYAGNDYEFKTKENKILNHDKIKPENIS